MKEIIRKEALLPTNVTTIDITAPTTTKSSNLFRTISKSIIVLLGVFSLLNLIQRSLIYHKHQQYKPSIESLDICNQFEAKLPSTNEILDSHKELIYSADFRLKSVEVHSGLVKIKSESFDDLGAVGEDKRWNVFYDVEAYLFEAFPLLHDKLTLTKVNTHGLIYEWKGSDDSLKPILLAAHQDTVPVNFATLDAWSYPPWSGEYDGKYVWGRGSSDCKNQLIALLEAVTLLLEGEFVPKRTILLAFGFDEESKGYEGAGNLALYLEENYGKDGIAFILDEGGLGIGEMYGKGIGFALPATGEKGYIDVNFTLSTPGGHSSIPPPHTGIGMLSSIITSLESSPYSPSISLSSPIFSLLQCAAKYGDLSKNFKKAVYDASSKKGKKSSEARKDVAEMFSDRGRAERYLVSTSQAVDIIGGGVKVNALPELSFFVANYRISVDSNSDVVKEKIKALVLPIVKKYSLDLEIFDEKVTSCHSDSNSLEKKVSGGLLKVVGINELNPAPISSIETLEWKTLSSTIQHVYSSSFEKGLVVSPCVMTGNTDTRFYWNLSKNIYRFTPGDRSGSIGIHTIDEHLLFDDHIAGIWFFHELIRNADEAEF